MTSEEAVLLVEKKPPSTWFAPVAADAYRKLRLLLHPDRFGPNKAWAVRAEAAIYKLDAAYAAFHGGAKLAAPVTIGKWVITAPICKGDICDVYRAESAAGIGVLKVARSPKDNDLMVAEHAILSSLNAPPKISFQHYLPEVLDTFKASGRMANVLSLADGYVPLSEITSMAKSIDFRHVVWMMNRALSVLGFGHDRGVVHGAVLPQHLLYHPGDHNLYLVDWCYAVSGDAHVSAIVKDNKDNYPPEILRKQRPGPETDLYMLAKALYGVADIPQRFRALFELCMLASRASRPSDAWAFQDKWRVMAELEYGKPRFIPLVLPVQ